MANIEKFTKEKEDNLHFKMHMHSLQKGKSNSIVGNIKILANFFQSIVIALAIATFIYIFVVTPSEVDGKSMEPTFYTGERLYTNRLTHWFAGTQVGNTLGLNYYRGDIIVFQKPGMDPLIKRIIALPGDTIELKSGHFYINDLKLEEGYLNANIYTNSGSFLGENQKVAVPDNSYFVAGDNRPVSNDSRYIGLIESEWIIGKPFLRIWPLDRIGILQ